MRQPTRNQETAVCSIDYAFRRLGGKYKARILMYLWHNKVLRYGELRRTITDITPKMLTQTLRELEEDKLSNELSITRSLRRLSILIRRRRCV